MNLCARTHRIALQALRGIFPFATFAAVLLAFASLSDVRAAGPVYPHLRTDDLPTTITGSRTVNVVFIGLAPGAGAQQIHPDFLSRLQSSFSISSGTNRGVFNPAVINGQMLYRTVDYNIVFAPQEYEDYFFSRLLNMAIGAYGAQQGFPQSYVATARVDRTPNFEQSPGVFRNACDFDNFGLFAFYPSRRDTSCVLSTQLVLPASPPDPPQVLDFGVTPFQWLYNFDNSGSPRTFFFDPHFDVPTPRPFNPILQNFFIDAPAVTAILNEDLPGLHSVFPTVPAIDVRNPTVVLINWWGRPQCLVDGFVPGCFVDHTYKKDDEPDRDTGFNFGRVDPIPAGSPDRNYDPLPFPAIQMRKQTTVSGWGGNAKNDPAICPPAGCAESRLVWYDLSVIDGWTDNGFMTLPLGYFQGGLDVEPQTNKGIAAYRIHPIWEYGANLSPPNPRDPLRLSTVDPNFLCFNEAYFNYDPFGDQSFVFKYRAFDDFTGDVAKLVNDAFVSNMVAKTWVYVPWALDSLARNHYPEQIQMSVSAYDPSNENPLINFLHPNLLKDVMQAVVGPTGPAISVAAKELSFTGNVADMYGSYARYDTSAPIGPPICDPFRYPKYREIPGKGYLSNFQTNAPVQYPHPGTGWSLGDPIFHPGRSTYNGDTYGWAWLDPDAFYNRNRFKEGFVSMDDTASKYELVNILFHLPPGLDNFALLGLATTNDADPGTNRQTTTLNFQTATQPLRLGNTNLFAHESGHHIGLSHPHNNVICRNASTDPLCTNEALLGFGSEFFGWAADESAGLMGYMDNSGWFSQSEQDAMAVQLIGAYFHNNNTLYKEIAKHPHALDANIASLLSQADSLEGAAIDALQHFDNAGAVAKGRQAHAIVMQVAALLNVNVQPPNEKQVREFPPEQRNEGRKTLRQVRKNLARVVDTPGGMGVDDVAGATNTDLMLADTLMSKLSGRTVPANVNAKSATALQQALAKKPPIPHGPLPVPSWK